MLQRVFLGFGSNKGNRESYIKRALNLLSSNEDFLFIAVSRIFETEPWGFTEQNKFLNCVACFLYRPIPEKLIGEIKKVENGIGRTSKRKWYPREIDIDVLLVNNKIIEKSDLKIPHPLLHLRNFVLEPLNELIPEFVHPVLGKKIKFLLKNSPDKKKVNLYKNKKI